MPNENDSRTEISEGSHISLKLVITLGIACLGILGAVVSSVWFASSLNEKVTMLVVLAQAHAVADKSQNDDIAATKVRVQMLEKYGSEVVALRVTDLERRQSDIERKFIK